MATPAATPVAPGTRIGHVHLKVADLDRAIGFYSGVLGFELTQKYGEQAAFLSAGGYHHHIGLNTWESKGGTPPAPGTTGLYHTAILYPTRKDLADALRRLMAAKIPLDGASDHGVSHALYLRDPDGNGVELYWDRARADWPHAPDGTLQMMTGPLDLQALLAAADAPASQPAASGPAFSKAQAPLSDTSRHVLRDLRGTLLQLHKVLLDDARVAYELDRGRVGSSAGLLQLVINDPWFAWLHSLSELVVRIDEVVEPDAPAMDADATMLIDQVGQLLTASETGEGFQRRYFEALQRQPAVVLAHADVRRVLKATR
jgi:catechol 2,3-dioxygenase